jgi:hypothetical protein
MHFLLAQASDKLTQQMLLERWPVEADAPDRSTLSRWLKRATRQGLVCCCGSGYRGNPLRYWLPGREPLLCKRPLRGQMAVRGWIFLAWAAHACYNRPDGRRHPSTGRRGGRRP